MNKDLLELLAEFDVPEIHSLEYSSEMEDSTMLVVEEKISKSEKKQLRDTVREIAESLAYAANTLEELKNAMEQFSACELKSTALQTVFSDGMSTSHIMLIGEAPGAEEDRLGKPFVGQSGQLLDKFLSFVSLSRENNVYIANTIPWRPPANRPPTPEEIFICLPFIIRHIELVKPKVIGLLGSTALKAFGGTSVEGIVKARGTWFEYTTPNEGFNVSMIPIFHPAFLLRSPSQKKFFWRDIIALAQKAKALGQS